MAFETERLHMPVAAAGHAARRAALFRESLPHVAERWVLGLAWSLMPNRIGGLPALAKLCFDEALSPDYALPDPERALEKPPGLAGIVHELDLPTLLSAYRRGLYPLAHVPPLKWWSPPTRSVLLFDDVHIAHKQRKLMRQGRYTVTFDRDFEQVIAACAGRREGRWHLTWITPRIMRVYAEAFDAGHAHSFEVWNKAGELVAGGYGLGVGAAFTSEVAVLPRAQHLEDRHDGVELALGPLGLPLQRRQADGSAAAHARLPRHAAAHVPRQARRRDRGTGQARALAGRGRPRHHLALGPEGRNQP